MSYRHGGWNGPAIDLDADWASKNPDDGPDTRAEHFAAERAMHERVAQWHAAHMRSFVIDGQRWEMAVGKDCPSFDKDFPYFSGEEVRPGEWLITINLSLLPESLFPAPLTREQVYRYTPDFKGIWFKWDAAQQSLVPLSRWEPAWKAALARARKHL